MRAYFPRGTPRQGEATTSPAQTEITGHLSGLGNTVKADKFGEKTGRLSLRVVGFDREPAEEVDFSGRLIVIEKA